MAADGAGSRGVPVGTFLGIGVVAAALSATAPISFDEGDWLSVVRRVAGGARLYHDVIGNKSPPVYWTIRLLDAAPGPFTAARAVFFGLLVACAGLAACVLSRELALPRRQALGLGGVVAVAVALQSAFVLNIETPAAVLVVAGMIAVARGRPWIGGAAAGAASVIDPRAAALLLGVILFAAERKDRRSAWRAAAAGAAVVAAWVVPVVLQPELRYALLEFNAASRGALGSWRPIPIAAVTVVTLLPVIAGVSLVRGGRFREWIAAGRRSRAGIVLAATTVALVMASVFPFLKYWILLAPAVPVLAAAVRRTCEAPSRARRHLALLSVVPLLVVVGSTSLAEARLVNRYEKASRVLGDSLRAGDTFVAFDPQPFMTTFLPDHAGLPWAVLDFLKVRTSHRTADLRRVAAAIERAEAIVDDGALAVEEKDVDPAFRPLWRIYRARLAGFSCLRRVAGLTIRFRPERCPAGAG